MLWNIDKSFKRGSNPVQLFQHTFAGPLIISLTFLTFVQNQPFTRTEILSAYICNNYPIHWAFATYLSQHVNPISALIACEYCEWACFKCMYPMQEILILVYDLYGQYLALILAQIMFPCDLSGFQLREIIGACFKM